MLYEFKFKRGECVFKIFTTNEDDYEIVKCLVIELHNIDPQAFSNLVIFENVHSVCETYNAHLKLTISNLHYGDGVDYVITKDTIERIMRTNNLYHLMHHFEPVTRRPPLQQDGVFQGHCRKNLRNRTSCMWRAAFSVARTWNRWRRFTIERVYHPLRMKRCFSEWAHSDIELKRQCISI